MKFAILSFAIILLMLQSCGNKKEKLPQGILAEPKMRAVLKDLMLADAAIYTEGIMANEGTKAASYYKFVFKKHETDKSTFEKSLKYYSEHADKMKDIYDKIIIELEKEELKK